MTARRVVERLAQLLDIDLTGVADGDALTYDQGSDTWVPGPGGGGVTDHGALTGLADNDHPQYQLAASAATDAELVAAVAGLQPLDADLTAIAALSTTAFGRGLLILANQAALLAAAGAAAASHAHAGEDITSGTVADARIAATLTRDTELTAAISAHEAAGDPHPTYTTAAELAAFAQPLDADLTAIAALTTTAFGRAFLALANIAAAQAALDLEPGTDVATQAAHDALVSALAAHLADATDAHDASAVSVVPFSTIAATTVQAALEEIVAEASGGVTDHGALTGLGDDDHPQYTLTAEAQAIADAAQAAAEATAQAALNAHTGDATDAHDASSISILDAAADFTATEVEGALAELQAADEADEAALAAHLADGTDAHAGTAITNTPAGTIAATTVQAAIDELATEKAAASHAHAGEDITSGTVADARIAATIARDSEVATAISTSESGQVRDGDAAGGVLGGTYPNPAFAADMATQAELDAVDAAKQPLDGDLTAIAALTTDAAGRGLLTLTDPGVDRIVFWDDSLGAYTHLTPGTNLTITGTTIDASGGSAAADDENLILHMQAFA